MASPNLSKFYKEFEKAIESENSLNEVKRVYSELQQLSLDPSFTIDDIRDPEFNQVIFFIFISFFSLKKQKKRLFFTWLLKKEKLKP